MDIDIRSFCRTLPKVELHAHLNGSLSRETMLQLLRLHADSGNVDNTNPFLSEFNIGEGDSRSLSDTFRMFDIAHSLTRNPDALSLATMLTLKEFQNDGCCYIELRSTPRNTEHMTKRQYLETIVKTIKQCSEQMTMISKFIVSINRSFSIEEGNEISDLAIEFYEKYPNIIVGIELSGNPTAGLFQSFVPALNKARMAGLKLSLHCGEVINPTEVLEMLKFKPDRIGHGIHIHPKFGGTSETWDLLCQYKIPVEMCLSSNVKTKSIADYESHHFKEFYEAEIPLIVCTDDKGVFDTSLSQEYSICAQTFQLDRKQLMRLAFQAAKYIFDLKLINNISDKFEGCINIYQ